MNPPDCRAEVKRYDEQRERSSTRLLIAGGNVDQHDRDENERLAFAVMVDLIASVAPTLRVPATRLLKTVGATKYLQRRQSALKPDYPLSPCADYMCHNECRMGEECPSAHVINLDSSQGTPFVRRTLRHVKAASEATIVQNEGRAQNGLFGMISGRSKRKVDIESTINDDHGAQRTAIWASSGSPGNTNSHPNDVSKTNSNETPSSKKLRDKFSDEANPVVDTETSSSPTHFNASTLATPSTGNDSGGGSGGGSGYGNSDGNPSITSDSQSNNDEQ
jgi:hypothetical protein